MPICNSLAIVFTMIVGKILGEEIGGKRKSGCCLCGKQLSGHDNPGWFCPTPISQGLVRRGPSAILPLSCFLVVITSLPLGSLGTDAGVEIGTSPHVSSPASPVSAPTGMAELRVPWFPPVIPGAIAGMVLTVMGITLCITSSVTRTHRQPSAL